MDITAVFYVVVIVYVKLLLVGRRSVYASNATVTRQSPIGLFFFTIIRCDFDGRGGACWIGNEKGKRNQLTATTTAKAPKKRRLSISPLASSALADNQNSSRANCYQEVGLIFHDNVLVLFKNLAPYVFEPWFRPSLREIYDVSFGFCIY